MLNRALCATLALALMGGVAFGQTYYGPRGTVLQPNVAAPYPLTPVSPGQHNVAPTSATGLSIPYNTYTAGMSFATIAYVCASTATVHYTTDGSTTPTGTIGMPLASGSCQWLYGNAVLSNFKAFSATGTLDIEYFQ